MSAYLLGLGFRADMGTCIRKLVLLKLIDACEDDGTRIFPAIATVARAAQCSGRQVQRELKTFVDIGLLTLVREGGKGRRSTNEYAMNLDVLDAIAKGGWKAYADEIAGGVKGDTVSPLECVAKGDTDDMLRVTQETFKGDNGCHPTPPYPSLDPSIERERAREPKKGQTETGLPAEPEDPKAVERTFWRVVKDWPGFAGMPKDPAKREWFALSAADRAEAEAKRDAWLKLLKRQRKSHIPAPSTYFREKLFQDVPGETQEGAQACVAAPFGKAWMAGRLARLLAGPTRPVNANMLTAFARQQLAEGQTDETTLLLAKQASTGFPAVGLMHERAAAGRGELVAPELAALGALMEAVLVGSDLWLAWEAFHEKQGWPWLPDPGELRAVYFPKGGPAAMAEFQAAIRERGEAA